MSKWLQLILVVGRLLVLTSAYCKGRYGSCPKGDSIVEYPLHFQNLNSNEYCGYPELGIKCAQDGRPLINISNHLYYYLSGGYSGYYYSDSLSSVTVVDVTVSSVTVVDVTVSSVTVVDVDIDGQACPHPRHNLSLEAAPALRLESGYRNVTIFYNCSNAPENEVQHLPCLNNNNTRLSYAFVDDLIPPGFNWYGNCQETVVVPVSSTSLLIEADYTKALKEGILLYTNTLKECDRCEASHGQCWSNNSMTTNGFRCLCANNRKTTNRTVLFDGFCPNGLLSTGMKVIIAVSAGVGGLLLSLLLLYKRAFHSLYNLNVSRWMTKIRGPTNVEVFLENYGCLALQTYTYSDVKKMTNSYKNTLGQGGYGSVFKGKLLDGRLVAIKILNETKGNGEDFINEVATIGRTNHINVVSLLGFCTEGNKRALVYEFMPNGSLERFIYNEQNSSTTTPPLGWERLYQIALGIARGLEYLHCRCNTRILHFDIKPHNILLDQDFTPKISDFGLAKLCPTRESVVSMVGARGTIGYIAPEVYCRNFGGVSHKSDVYSYGMMVLEMIGGRKNIDATVENTSEIYFPHWIYNHLKRDTKVEGPEDIKIEVPRETFEDEKAKKMIIVALWCIQTHPINRPSVSKVVEMLEGGIEELQMPPNPFEDPPPTSSAS